jgi:hypothetical protein
MREVTAKGRPTPRLPRLTLLSHGSG